MKGLVGDDDILGNKDWGQFPFLNLLACNLDFFGKSHNRIALKKGVPPRCCINQDDTCFRGSGIQGTGRGSSLSSNDDGWFFGYEEIEQFFYLRPSSHGGGHQYFQKENPHP